MDRHVIDALLGLLLDDFEHHLPAQVFDAAHAGERFIDRHGADGHGRGVDDRLADGRDIAAGGEIHDRVGAVLHRVAQFLELPFDIGDHGRIADVGVDLAVRCHADAHGLEVLVMDVGRDDHPPARDFGADQFRLDLLALGDVAHLLRDDALAGIVHLRADCCRSSVSATHSVRMTDSCVLGPGNSSITGHPGPIYVPGGTYFFFFGFLVSFLGLLSLATRSSLTYAIITAYRRRRPVFYLGAPAMRVRSRNRLRARAGSPGCPSR